MKENLIDKLHEADCLENLKRNFETSTLKDDPKLKSFLNNAESIIKRDMNHFEEISTNKLKDITL